MGVKVFSKNKDNFLENKCPYRLCQDAILSLFPFMTKRKVKCSVEEFKFLFQGQSIKFEDIPNEALRNEIREAGPGSLVVYTEKDGPIQDLDCLVCLNHAASITPMASKEVVSSFKARYL